MVALFRLCISEQKRIDAWMGKWIQAQGPSMETLARMVLSPELNTQIKNAAERYLDARYPQWQEKVVGVVQPKSPLPKLPDPYLSTCKQKRVEQCLLTLGIAAFLVFIGAVIALSFSCASWLMHSHAPLDKVMLLKTGIVALASWACWAPVFVRDAKRHRAWMEKVWTLGTPALVQLQAASNTKEEHQRVIHRLLNERDKGWSVRDDVPLWNAACICRDEQDSRY